MAQPTYLFTVAGISLYEHPTLGDDHPLLAKHNGKYIATDFWEKPDHYEMTDFWQDMLDAIASNASGYYFQSGQ